VVSVVAPAAVEVLDEVCEQRFVEPKLEASDRRSFSSHRRGVGARSSSRTSRHGWATVRSLVMSTRAYSDVEGWRGGGALGDRWKAPRPLPSGKPRVAEAGCGR